MIERAYDRGGRSKRLRTIDQKRILDKVAELEVAIGSPTTAREIASALNRENAELAASSPGSSRGIKGMQGRSPTFYTTKLVAADLSVLRRKGLVSRELDHVGGSAVYGRTDKAYSRTYDRRNSAMFTKTTGTFRQFGGERFILDDVYGTKDQARYMAGYWRARGMNARVIPVKNGSAIYVRKRKGRGRPSNPGISSRRRGK